MLSHRTTTSCGTDACWNNMHEDGIYMVQSKCTIHSLLMYPGLVAYTSLSEVHRNLLVVVDLLRFPVVSHDGIDVFLK
jgi:hypothetical protein